MEGVLEWRVLPNLRISNNFANNYDDYYGGVNNDNDDDNDMIMIELMVRPTNPSVLAEGNRREGWELGKL